MRDGTRESLEFLKQVLLFNGHYVQYGMLKRHILTLNQSINHFSLLLFPVITLNDADGRQQKKFIGNNQI